MTSQIYRCKHEHESPCFGGCQCEGCKSDRERSRQRAVLISQLSNRYRTHLYKMDISELKLLVRAKDK